MPRFFFSLVFLIPASGKVAGADEIAPPRPLVDGVSVELIAAEPDIVTPVGMAFDNKGRLLVVESHTHKRQEDYGGPEHDRVRVLADTNGDGKLSSQAGDRWSTFAEGYTHAMNLAVHPDSGDVYLVCRNDVHRLRDTDGDGVADEDTVIVRVETDVNYPHNGLGGIAIAGDKLFLGFGENFGAAYTLIGSDETQISDRGGVGIVFTCDLQGQSLEKYAVGFWNPFGLCYVDLGRGAGELFCVDNDPDASPPCRLIHVLPAGDYGHRWEYGRAGLHPLQAWDGELPGTLGMMAGTGEAPCTVLEHNGWLWVTSWGEHRIERYRVKNGGDRLTAEREIVLQGDANFRPTGMTVAPDGSIYFSDWVSRSYPVHGAGRVWRIKIEQENRFDIPLESTTSSVRQSKIHRASSGGNYWISRGKPGGAIEAALGSDRLLVLQAMRFKGTVPSRSSLLPDLEDPDPGIRLYAVRWIADEHLTELRDDVAKLLEGEIPNERYYLAVLAAVDWLDGDRKPRGSGIADDLLLAEIDNTGRPAETRALALRLADPNLRRLSIERLQGFYRTGPGPLRVEAVRTLAGQRNPRRVHLLRKIARDDSASDAVRADAVMGLGAFAQEQEPLLQELANDNSPTATRSEAQRVLRLAKLGDSPTETKPAADDIDAWLELIEQESGDADSGRRLFHGSLGARCAVCHQHSGRGGQIGPELTHVGGKLSRRRLVESILQPSREVAPRYEPWVLETADGRVLTGLRLPKAGDDGVERYADNAGESFEIASRDIDARYPGKASIMPSGLEQLISVRDLRDLMAFLQKN